MSMRRVYSKRGSETLKTIQSCNSSSFELSQNCGLCECRGGTERRIFGVKVLVPNDAAPNRLPRLFRARFYSPLRHPSLNEPASEKAAMAMILQLLRHCCGTQGAKTDF